MKRKNNCKIKDKPNLKDIKKKVKRIFFIDDDTDIQIKNNIDILVSYKINIFNWLTCHETDSKQGHIYEKVYDIINNKLEEGLRLFIKKKYSREQTFKYYPDMLYADFNTLIFNKKEFNINKLDTYTDQILDLRKNNENFKLTNTQNFIKTYISPDTPYKGLLLWHGVGVGKSCGAISIAENFKKIKGKKCIIVLPSETLTQNWQDEIINIKKELNKINPNSSVQCSLDGYVKDLQIEDWKQELTKNADGTYDLKKKNTKHPYNTKINKLHKHVKKLISEHYEFTTYGKLSNKLKKICKHKNYFEQIEYIKKEYSNKIFIMDEIHQTRDNTITTSAKKKKKKKKKKQDNIQKKSKEGSDDAEDVAISKDDKVDEGDNVDDYIDSGDEEEIPSIENYSGKNIRPYLEMISRYTTQTHMILLSATPIYNFPTEIEWLLNLLLWNDGRGPIQNIFKKVKQTDQFIQTDTNMSHLKNKARGYVSYVRGENPFTFPIKLSPRLTLSNDDWNENNQPYWYPNDWKFPDSSGALQPIHNNTIPYFFPDYFSDNQYNLFLPQLQTLKKNLYATKLLSSYSNIIYPSKEDDGIIGTFDENFKKIKKYNNRYTYIDSSNPFMNIKNMIGGENKGLQQYSIKIFNIMESIRKSLPIKKDGYTSGNILRDVQHPGGGIIFIYSKFKTSGIIPNAFALEEMGFNRFSLQKSGSPHPANYMNNNMLVTSRTPDARFCAFNKCRLQDIDPTNKEKIKHFNKTFTQARYIYLDGEMDKRTLNKLVKEVKGEGISNKSNTYGENIMVILGTKVVEVGISFFNIRQIHIMEGWYHYNEMIQVVGRGSRNFSHKKLKKMFRNIMVYLHIGTVPPSHSNKIETIDEYLYKKSYIKKTNIIEVEKLLKQTSIDCRLNKKGNMYIEEYYGDTLKITDTNPIIDSMGTRIKDNIEDKPNSINCDTGECSLTCENEEVEEKINVDTFSHTHNKKFITQTKLLIKDLFTKKHYYELQDIVNKIKNHPDFFGYAINDENKKQNNNIVYSALHDIYEHKETIIHKKNKGYMIMFVIQLPTYEQSFYVFQPYIIDESNVETYSSIHKDSFKKKYNKYKLKIDNNNARIKKLTKKTNKDSSNPISIKKELESNKLLYKKINNLFKSLIDHQDVSIPIINRNKNVYNNVPKDIELLNKDYISMKNIERNRKLKEQEELLLDTTTEQEPAQEPEQEPEQEPAQDVQEDSTSDTPKKETKKTKKRTLTIQEDETRLTQINSKFEKVFVLKKWYTFLCDSIKNTPFTEHILTMRRYHEIDMLSYDNKKILLKNYLQQIQLIDDTTNITPNPDIINNRKIISQTTQTKLKKIYEFYEQVKKTIFFVYEKFFNKYTAFHNIKKIDTLLTKFINTFKNTHPTLKKDTNAQIDYIITQLVYLFIKYDDTFCFKLLGHFRNIEHIEKKYKSSYFDIFRNIIEEYIDNKRPIYDSFTKVQLSVDSSDFDINDHPSITSPEHILHPDKDYKCMGDLYKDYPEIMNKLIVCEFFDKNQNKSMYKNDQNYVIKRHKRDKIIPANITIKPNYSDKILGFSLVLGGTKPAQLKKTKLYQFNQYYFSLSTSVNRWITQDPLSATLKKYKLEYKDYTYGDNKLIGISTTMKQTRDSTINIKLLDKKTSIKTIKGTSNRKQENTGSVCKSGNQRMQLGRLQKDIYLLLNNSTLDYNKYIDTLNETFTGASNKQTKKIISKSLLLYIDGISNESNYTIPEDIPIIHYIKRKKRPGVTDLCIIISTLLRYKEFESMFYESKTYSNRWFYNNNESNNKYKQIFNK